MRARRVALPAIGDPRARVALLLGLVALLAILPLVVAWSVQNRAPVRVTVADVRAPDDEAMSARLAAERERGGSGTLIVVRSPEQSAQFCPVLGGPRYCALIRGFPEVVPVQAASAADAVAALYGDDARLSPVGAGVYALERRTAGGGAGLLPALLVSIVLAVAAALVLLAPQEQTSPRPDDDERHEPGDDGRYRPGDDEQRARTMPPAPRRPQSARSTPERRPRGRPAENRPAQNHLAQDRPTQDRTAQDRPARDLTTQDRPARDRPVARDLREPPAVGDEVTCRTHFGPHGGFVCFGGALVLWAENDGPDLPEPGDRLVIVHTGPLHVAAAANHRPPYAEEAR